MNDFKCDDCGKWLKAGATHCLCGWRSTPKLEKPEYICRFEGCHEHEHLKQCGYAGNYYYVCTDHFRDLVEKEEAMKNE